MSSTTPEALGTADRHRRVQQRRAWWQPGWVVVPIGVVALAFVFTTFTVAGGFSAVMVTDTAFFRNPNYHAAGDTAESLDYSRMAKVVSAVFAVTQGY